MNKLHLNVFICLLLVVVLSGCAAEPMPRIFWPPPPGETALELVGVYYSDADFTKSGWQLFLDSFLGGNSGDRFSRPTGIASDGRGRVYVADQLIGNVRIFDFNERHMHMLTQTPVLSFPGGLAIDSQKRLFVADTGNQKIAVFSPDDAFLFAFGSSELFERPAYLTINERLGRIYVSDGKGHKIVVFDLQGKHLFSFGQIGSDPGDFYGPQGLAIDRDNRLFVADQFNARIQVFDADGKYLRHFGERGDGRGQLEMPKDLAFNSAGELYVVDVRKAALTVFTPEGAPLLSLGGKKTTSAMGFSNPSFIYIDGNDRIHITDMITLRFVIWQYLSPSYLQLHPVSAEDLQTLEKLKKSKY